MVIRTARSGPGRGAGWSPAGGPVGGVRRESLRRSPAPPVQIRVGSSPPPGCPPRGDGGLVGVPTRPGIATGRGVPTGRGAATGPGAPTGAGADDTAVGPWWRRRGSGRRRSRLARRRRRGGRWCRRGRGRGRRRRGRRCGHGRGRRLAPTVGGPARWHRAAGAADRPDGRWGHDLPPPRFAIRLIRFGGNDLREERRRQRRDDRGAAGLSGDESAEEVVGHRAISR